MVPRLPYCSHALQKMLSADSQTASWLVGSLFTVHNITGFAVEVGLAVGLEHRYSASCGSVCWSILRAAAVWQAGFAGQALRHGLIAVPASSQGFLFQRMGVL